MTAPQRVTAGAENAFERISEHLYRFEDTCNVYVVVDPQDTTRCVLIDFGSGACLDRLGEIGVSRVEWILHTHHHRDQAQGDHLAVMSFGQPGSPQSFFV